LAFDPYIALARKIKASRREAFQKLYESCWKDLFLCAYQLTVCEELAKGFTQEAFVKLWENRDKINPTQSLKPYLFRCPDHPAKNKRLGFTVAFKGTAG